MAYTVEPSTAQTIDLDAKDVSHLNTKFEKKFVSTERVEKVIVFDPRKGKTVQVVANGQAYSIDTTTTAGEGNTNILSAAVPWVSLKSGITTDELFGPFASNRGILAIRITSGTVAVPVDLTDDFEIAVIQHGSDDGGT